MKQTRQDPPQRWMVMAAVGTELAVAVAVGMYIGNWLDQRWLQKYVALPLGMLLGTIAGFAAGLYNLLRLLRWADRDPANRDEQDVD